MQKCMSQDKDLIIILLFQFYRYVIIKFLLLNYLKFCYERTDRFMKHLIQIKNCEILFKFKTKAYALFQQLGFSKYLEDFTFFQEQQNCLIQHIFQKITQKFKEKKAIQNSMKQQISKLQSEILDLKQNSSFQNKNIQFLKSSQLKLKQRISTLNQDCARTTERLIWREKQNQAKQSNLFELKNIIKQKDEQNLELKKFYQLQISQFNEQKMKSSIQLNQLKKQILKTQSKNECKDAAILTMIEQTYQIQNQSTDNQPQEIECQKTKNIHCNCQVEFSIIKEDFQNKNEYLQKESSRLQRSYEQLKFQYEKFTKKTYEIVQSNLQLRNKNVTLSLQNQNIKQQLRLLKENNNSLLKLLNPPQKLLQKKVIGQNLQNMITPKNNHILVYKSKKMKQIIAQNQLFLNQKNSSKRIQQQSLIQQSMTTKKQENQAKMIQQIFKLKKKTSVLTSYAYKSHYQNIRHQIKQINSMDGSISDSKLDYQTKADSLINSTFGETLPSLKCLQKNEIYHLDKTTISPQRSRDLIFQLK